MICANHLFVAGRIALSLSVVALISSCANQPGSSPKQEAENACRVFGPKTLAGGAIGTVGGAAGGAALGAAVGAGKGAAIGAVGGAVAGLIAGLGVGHSYDQKDCAEAQRALAQMRNARTGYTAFWVNPSNGHHGSYTATGDEYSDAQKRVCRPVREVSALGGQQPTTQNLLTCRTPDGDYTTVQGPTS